MRCADHVTLLYPQKLALTSQTGGGRSVGIVRARTKATEFFFRVAVYCENHAECVIIPLGLNAESLVLSLAVCILTSRL